MPFQTNGASIVLDGHCSIEEAQSLFDAVRGMEGLVFDVSRAQSLHTAIIQIFMASSGSVRGDPSNRLLAACFGDRVNSPD